MPDRRVPATALSANDASQGEPLLSRRTLQGATPGGTECEREYIYVMYETSSGNVAAEAGVVCTFKPGRYGVVTGDVSSGNRLQPAGVVCHTLSDGHYGWVQRSGYCPQVNTDDGVDTAGVMLIVHETSDGIADGSETADATGVAARIGWAVQADENSSCPAVLTLP